MLYSIARDTVKRLIVFSIGRKNFSRIFETIIFLRSRSLRLLRFIRTGWRNPPVPVSLEKYGDNGHQVFFGYYDISPFNFDESILLATRAPFLNTPPQADIPLEIGYYHLRNGLTKFVKIGRTTTWCWQQGCRLQWYPLSMQGENNRVIYNALIDNQFGCYIQDIWNNKIVRQYRRAIYSVSPDGRFGLSLNFSRLGRLRPGYGYVNLPDETEGELAPEEDGIWYIDMDTGEDTLLLSIADIVQLKPLETMQGAEHYFNHICLNPDGTRFLFFHVWLKEGERYTRLITCNADGSEPYALINEGHVSHYTWKSSDEILCFSTHANTGMKYHLYRDKTSYKEVVGDGLLVMDGHPSYSPGDHFILTDTYPDRYSDRHLLLFDVAHKQLIDIGGFFSPYKYKGELRCDLHPRWSPSGSYIAFDSAHEGRRSLYIFTL